MNPVIEIYVHLSDCLEGGDKELPDDIRKRIKRLAKKCHGTYAGRLSDKEMDDLFLSVYSVKQGLRDEFSEVTDEFTMKAFKDLTVLKNPQAMPVFLRIRAALGFENDMFLFTSKTIERDDGSAVLVLHVSSLARLHYVMPFSAGNLTEGAKINYR
jgi:hypothetical protein